MLYLSARAISQASLTRQFLFNLTQVLNILTLFSLLKGVHLCWLHVVKAITIRTLYISGVLDCRDPDKWQPTYKLNCRMGRLCLMGLLLFLLMDSFHLFFVKVMVLYISFHIWVFPIGQLYISLLRMMDHQDQCWIQYFLLFTLVKWCKLIKIIVFKCINLVVVKHKCISLIKYISDWWHIDIDMNSHFVGYLKLLLYPSAVIRRAPHEFKIACLEVSS